jgi:hypothetical protein
MPSSFSRTAFVLLCIAFVSGCGEPPNKELHQAQGAIAAARAAGAERYAADEYKAAVDALARADTAVTERDYRLALNNALDARERAQNAAREAADRKAAARGRAERLLAETTTALAAATARIEAAHAAHVPRKSLTAAGDGVAAVQKALQEAGAALGREDYQEAQRILEPQIAAARAIVLQVDQVMAGNPAGKPARRTR